MFGVQRFNKLIGHNGLVRCDGGFLNPATGSESVSGSPTGVAGGDLAGTYPNPTLKSPLTDVITQHLRVTAPVVPGTAGATGIAGQIAWDSGFIYVCVATNTWVRAAIATW